MIREALIKLEQELAVKRADEVFRYFDGPTRHAGWWATRSGSSLMALRLFSKDPCEATSTGLVAASSSKSGIATIRDKLYHNGGGFMRRSFLIALLVVTILYAANEAIAQSKEQLSTEAVARVVGLLERSDYRYRKLSPSQWLVAFKGDHRPEVEVYFMATEDDLSVVAVVATKSEVVNEGAMAAALLRRNATIQTGQFMIDADEDFVASVTIDPVKLSVEDFKRYVNAVATAADDAFGETKSHVATVAAPGAPARSFSAPRSSDRILELLGGRASLKFDSKLWTEVPPDAEKRQFKHSRGDGYAMLITERLEVPTDSLRAVAMQNARDGGATIEKVTEERRVVNGKQVLMLELHLKLKGIPVVYLGYYWGGPAGTIQVVTYTGTNLIDEYKSDFEDFLNGLVIQ